ncbi:MAG TPA: methyltransferase domain-containing protein [Candidatus Saccharimonadales bacterium]|nr:methyltransferase domain-containing protein [Candidatus Saccharimonadales bacterium]
MDGYSAAYFKQINDEEGPQAERLADVLIWKYSPKSVIDIGCASGLYLKPFLDRNVKVRGLDNAKAVIDDEVLQIPRRYIELADITKNPPKTKADLALCIEVMEHIPKSGAKPAIRHLTQASDLIIFSAAQPGQGGVGHINCQLPSYWQALFAKNGFERQYQDESYLKTIISSGYHMGWLINNLMVLRKKS